ncbi:MAG: nucleotidyltransferase domain-containing protein [Promethearchaeota archaeon]
MFEFIMAKRGISRAHKESVIYSKQHWSLLKQKRVQALKLLKMFQEEGLSPYVYGSVARGDVGPNSDIDIIFIENVPSYLIEFILYKNGYKRTFREIIMATPRDSLKLYIYLSELECISLPLTRFTRASSEFYDFGGKINLHQLEKDERVPGVDKKLILIKPTPVGHEELSIIDNEPIVAKELGIHLNTVNERITVLTRREKHGKTGVFLKKTLSMEESVEDVLKNLAKKNSIIRGKLL